MENKRNKKGEGTVFQLKTGKWIAKIVKDGKTISKTADSEAAAYCKLAEIKREFKRIDRLKKKESELANNPQKISTEEMFKRFLNYKRTGRAKIEEKSILRLESTVNTHIIPNCGLIPFLSLNSNDIECILDKMYAKRLGHSSIKKVYDAFNACFKYAIYVEHILEMCENPMFGVTMFSSNDFEKNELQIYSKDEIIRITRECLAVNSDGSYIYRYGRVYLFLLNCGLREGELCGLKKADFDLDDSLLTVERTAITIKVNPDNDIPYWDTIIKNKPKTEKGRRFVPLNGTAQKYARMILAEFPDGNLFIYTKNGKIVSPASLNKYLNIILCNAGVQKKGGLHTLRDTFASRLFEEGVDIRIISDILGHTDSRVTEQHYIKIIERQKMKAVKLVDSI